MHILLPKLIISLYSKLTENYFSMGKKVAGELKDRIQYRSDPIPAAPKNTYYLTK